MSSPIGDLTLVAEGEWLVEVRMNGRDGDGLSPGQGSRPGADPASERTLGRAREELDAYFAGRLRSFTVRTRGAGTPFQQRVWDALRTIPYGETVSYKAIAERVGSPNAMRAVGAANGANPVAIVVPCHRVIGANGALVGYGGGLDRKTWLLEHEQGARLL